MSYWAARSIWPLGEAVRVLGPDSLPRLDALRPALDRAVTRMARDIDAGQLLGGSVTATSEALLGLLAQRACTGYELTRTFDESLAHVWPTKHSQIYPELARLQAAGLIRQSGSGARRSKTYSVTDEGIAEVRRWMTETVPADTTRTERMLRVFFLWLLTPEEARAYLEQQRERHRARIAEYQTIAPRIPGSEGHANRMSRIALEAGIRVESALADWAEWALVELS